MGSIPELYYWYFLYHSLSTKGRTKDIPVYPRCFVVILNCTPLRVLAAFTTMLADVFLYRNNENSGLYKLIDGFCFVSGFRFIPLDLFHKRPHK